MDAILRAALIFIFLPVLIPMREASAGGPEALARGVRCLSDGDYFAAVKWLERAVGEEPANKDALRCLGCARLLTGNVAACVKALDRAIELDAKDAVLHYVRGLAHQFLGKSKRATGDFDEALRLDPKHYPACAARVRTLLENGDLEAALLESDRYNTLTTRASRSREWKDEWPTADFAKAKRIDFQGLPVYLAWWDLYEEYRRNRKRLGARDTGGGKSIADLRWRGLVCATQQDLDGSVKTFGVALERNREDWVIYRLRGLVHVVRGNDRAALADFSEAIRLRSRDADLYEWRARIHTKLGELTEASDDHQRASEILDQQAGGAATR